MLHASQFGIKHNRYLLIETRNSPPPKGEKLMNMESDWTVYRTRFVVRARQLTDSLIFTDALGREQSGQAGDYLVEIFDGLLSIIPRKFFEDIYVPLETAATDSGKSKNMTQPTTILSDRPSSALRSPGKVEQLPPQVVNDRGSPLRAPSLIAARSRVQRHESAPLIA